MNRWQRDVLEFHRLFAMPRPGHPTPLPVERILLRRRLIAEESRELRAALVGGDPVSIAKESCDVIYVTLGAAIEAGIDLTGPWNEVHSSNMRKAGGRMRPDGKLLKPDGWEPPTEGDGVGDSVNNPSHYTSHPSGVECIAITEHLGFCIGNAIKYLWRAGLKDGAAQIEDLAKAEWYIGREIDRLGGASVTKCYRENLRAAETLLAELRRVNERAAELQAMNNRQRRVITELQAKTRNG